MLTGCQVLQALSLFCLLPFSSLKWNAIQPPVRSPPPVALYHPLSNYALGLAPAPSTSLSAHRSLRLPDSSRASPALSLATWLPSQGFLTCSPWGPPHLPEAPHCLKVHIARSFVLGPPIVSSSQASGFYGPPKSPKHTGDWHQASYLLPCQETT